MDTEGVIIVGTRPTLPNHQVENESENSLRFRSSQFPSPEVQSSLPSSPACLATASTPAETQMLGVDGRKSPSFGTPGSLSGFSPVDLYMTPPSHVEDTSVSSEISEVKINLNQNYEVDSGYGNNSSKRSVFNPFHNPEGSYLSQSKSSIWEQFSPIKELKWKWKSKPRFIADSEGNIMDEFGVDQQQVLGFLVLMIVSASLGFAFLASFRNMNEDSLMERNGKYDSIGFGRQKVLERSRKEGRVIEEVRDEFGNLLGGKKAAIQFSYEISRSMENVAKADDNATSIREEDSMFEVQKQISVSEVLGNVILQDTSDQAKEILKTASELKVKDAEVRKLKEEVQELDDKKKQKLELIRKIKAFDVKVPKIPELGKNLAKVGNDNSGNVEITKKMKLKKSKVHVNPLLKSVTKGPKITKVKLPRNSPVVKVAEN